MLRAIIAASLILELAASLILELLVQPLAGALFVTASVLLQAPTFVDTHWAAR